MTDTEYIDSIVAALRGIVPVSSSAGGMHQPEFGGNEWNYVKECLDTGWVSSVGAYVDRFERMLKAFTGATHAVAVVNGTAALHLCLQLIGVRPGDEVIMPTLTFIATANAVAYCGATPHFADSGEATLGLDPAKLATYLRATMRVSAGECINRQTGARVSAVVPMHTFGHPVDLDPLVAVCEEFHIPLVEDAAESLGSYYKGRHTGRFGKLAALSFNGNKVITTGGGGAVLTDDPALGRLAKHLSTTAREPHRWSFNNDQVGYNYRLPNLNAALGCAQLEQLPGFLVRKRALAEAYVKAFDSMTEVRVFHEPPESHSNYWLNAIILNAARAHTRDAILERTNGAGIATRPAWTLMHKLAMFRDCQKMDLSTAERLEAQIINIPSSAVLGAPYVRP